MLKFDSQAMAMEKKTRNTTFIREVYSLAGFSSMHTQKERETANQNNKMIKKIVCNYRFHSKTTDGISFFLVGPSKRNNPVKPKSPLHSLYYADYSSSTSILTLHRVTKTLCFTQSGTMFIFKKTNYNEHRRRKNPWIYHFINNCLHEHIFL